MARFYANENFSRPIVDELRRLGHDVLTSFEAGRANQRVPDDEVLRFATSLTRAVVTFNRRHFWALHRRSQDHAGIVTCTVDADYVGLAVRIDSAVRAVADLRGQLIRIRRRP